MTTNILTILLFLALWLLISRFVLPRLGVPT